MLHKPREEMAVLEGAQVPPYLLLSTLVALEIRRLFHLLKVTMVGMAALMLLLQVLRGLLAVAAAQVRQVAQVVQHLFTSPAMEESV
jgi:hypothetical protein